MQEIALLLTGIAGAASAAAYKKFPRQRIYPQSIGSSRRIMEQAGALQVERDILSRSIARLQEGGVGITEGQRDRLLVQYQRQLGTVLAGIDRLERASKHPDIGPLGDGLVALMDQKLSGIDQKLREMSSRIAAEKIPAEDAPKKERAPKIAPPPASPAQEIDMGAPAEKLELATLTSVSRQAQEVSWPEEPRQEVHKPVQPAVPQDRPRQEPAVPAAVQDRPEPVVPIPPPAAPSEPDLGDLEDDNDDELDRIKRDIMKTLKKLDQAEVE